MRLVIVTTVTLVAFAANSILCRLALGANLIDPVLFTALRLVSGAVALTIVSDVLPESQSPKGKGGDWVSGFALFAYAIAFSLAYVSLGAGTGALILFGTVQVTMIGAALKSGERLKLAQWVGLTAAISGLTYLVLPGLSAPDPIGALLMCLAGMAWSVYSIRGKCVSAPISMTAGNFLRSAPLALIAVAIVPYPAHLKFPGIVLALISGVITSGLGYVFWYKALRGLTTTQASAAQLLVPVFAALGGVAFLSEQAPLRLIIASALILGGVALTLRKTNRDIVLFALKSGK
ncbi:MAG: DMT family transporter [Acidobacteria bacterium]|nr:DMT family transporter [Acidobacteriota bacterium]